MNSERPKRRFLQFRLSTVVVTVVAISGLMYLNLVCTVDWKIDVMTETYEVGYDSDGHRISHLIAVHYFQNSYGFPIPVLKERVEPHPGTNPLLILSRIENDFDFAAVVFDAATALWLLSRLSYFGRSVTYGEQSL